jgi:DNA-binding transcriptional ArsR family regulator
MSEQLLIDHELVDEMAELMRLLSDPTRLRVLGLLQPGEMNVTGLCGKLDLAQPTVSHHLGLLRSAGLVQTRREGKQIHYSLNPQYLQADASGLRLSYGTVRVVLDYGKSPAPGQAALRTNGTAGQGAGNGAGHAITRTSLPPTIASRN